ncbi:MAG: hypothetical protein SWO11_10780 [Thermodesulfobacteriota bacterium]|nr:hypothetical protein [Thermodesulfobacteriota bacterium]
MECKKIDVIRKKDEEGNQTTIDLKAFLEKQLKVSIQPRRDIIGIESVNLSIPKYDEATTITSSYQWFYIERKDTQER